MHFKNLYFKLVGRFDSREENRRHASILGVEFMACE